MTAVFLCSPHPGGPSDRLGLAAARGANAETVIRLRQYGISGCQGCGYCHDHGGQCHLDNDGTEEIFATLAKARAAIFAAPVYFYALPGQFKLLIDRSERFWPDLPETPAMRNAGIILTAGRMRGERLFEGALLTLTWFLRPFGYRISTTLLARGMDNATSVSLPFQEALTLGRDIGSQTELDP